MSVAEDSAVMRVARFYKSPHPPGNFHAVRSTCDLSGALIGTIPTGSTVTVGVVRQVDNGIWGKIDSLLNAKIVIEDGGESWEANAHSAWIMIKKIGGMTMFECIDDADHSASTNDIAEKEGKTVTTYADSSTRAASKEADMESTAKEISNAETAQLEREMIAKEKADAAAAEEAARLERERIAKEKADAAAVEEAARLERERIAKEKADAAAVEEAARMERDRVTKENAEEKLRLERERIAKEKAEKAEQEELDRQRRCAENARRNAIKTASDAATSATEASAGALKNIHDAEERNTKNSTDDDRGVSLDTDVSTGKAADGTPRPESDQNLQKEEIVTSSSSTHRVESKPSNTDRTIRNVSDGSAAGDMKPDAARLTSDSEAGSFKGSKGYDLSWMNDPDAFPDGVIPSVSDQVSSSIDTRSEVDVVAKASTGKKRKTKKKKGPPASLMKRLQQKSIKRNRKTSTSSTPIVAAQKNASPRPVAAVASTPKKTEEGREVSSSENCILPSARDPKTAAAMPDARKAKANADQATNEKENDDKVVAVPKKGYNMSWMNDPSAFPGGVLPSDAESSTKTDEADQRPLSERLVHKVWKTRSEAYVELGEYFKKTTDFSSTEVMEYVALFPKFTKDSNAAASKNATLAMTRFAEKSSIPEDIAQGMLTKLIESSLNNVRSAEVATELLVLMLGAASSSATTVAAIVKGFKSRKRKVPPACVSCLTKAFQKFGINALKSSITDIIQAMPPLFDAKDKNTRDQVKELAVEMCRWTGPSLFSGLIDGLRANQQKTLQERFDEVSKAGAPKPSAVPSAASESDGAVVASESSSSGPSVDAVDTWDFLPKKKLLSQLPKSFFKDLEPKVKWKVKVGALQSMLAIAKSNPRFEPSSGDYGNLLRTLARLVKQDKNVQVVSKAIQCVRALIEGLRNDFPGRKSLVALLLSKYKEKHRSVQTAVDAALNSFTARCYTVDQIEEEIYAATTDKKPDVRLRALEWFSGYAENIVDKKFGSMYAAPEKVQRANEIIISVFEKALGDANQKVRASALAGFRILKRSEDAKECFADLMGRLKKSHARAHKALTQSESTAPVTAAKAPTKKKKSVSSAKSKTSSKSSSPKKKQKAAVEAKKETTDPDVGAQTLLEMDDAIDEVGALGIPDWETHAASLKAKKWQDKKAAMLGMAKFVTEKDRSEWATRESSVIALYSCAFRATREFKDSNFNIINASFELVTVISKQCGKLLGRSLAQRVVVVAAGKLGDRKVGTKASEIVFALSEHSCGPQWVCRKMIEASVKIKSPVALVGLLSTLEQMVKDFTLRVLPRKELTAHAIGKQGGYGHANTKVRKSAASLLASIYAQIGETYVEDIASTVSDAALKTLKKQFANVEVVPLDQMKATRAVAQELAAEVASEAAESAIDRIDISSKLTSSLMKKLRDSASVNSWKTRVEGLNTLSGILKTAKFAIDMNRSTASYVRVVGERIAESNHNVRLKALNVCAEIGRSVELSKRRRVAKLCAEQIFLAMGDKKRQIADAALHTVTDWIKDMNGQPTCLGVMLHLVHKAFARPNARLSMLKFLEAHMGNMSTVTKDDASAVGDLIKHLVECLQDRLQALREASSNVLSISVVVLRRSGSSESDIRLLVDKACRNVKPAAMRELKKYVECALANAKSAADDTDDAPTKTSEVRPVSAKSSSVSAASKRSKAKKTRETKSARSAPKKVHRAEKKNAAESEDSSFWVSLSESGWKADKRKRQQKFDVGKLRWTISVDPTLDVPEKDVTWLKSELRKRVRDSCVEHLFEASVAKQLTGMKAMFEGLFSGSFFENAASGKHGGWAPAVYVMDLLLKWCSYRMSLQPHSQATNQLIANLERICDVAERLSYRMCDFEASSIIPSIIERGFGDAKPRVRSKFRALLVRICHLYPASKVAESVLMGLGSKNKRTVVECLDELRRLVAESGSGWHVIGRKGVKLVARNVKASSGEVRNGALQILQQVWLSLQRSEEELLKIADVKSVKVKDLIHEKLRHSNKTAAPTSKKKVPTSPPVRKNAKRGRAAAITPNVKTPFKSPAISRLVGEGRTPMLASPGNFDFQPLRISLSPTPSVAVEGEGEETSASSSSKEDENETVDPVVARFEKHVECIVSLSSLLEKYAQSDDMSSDSVVDALDVGCKSVDFLATMTGPKELSTLESGFNKLCVALLRCDRLAYQTAVSVETKKTDDDSKFAKGLVNFLWHSFGALQSLFSLQTLAKYANVQSLVDVLSLTLELLVFLRKSASLVQKETKWNEVRSRVNVLTIQAAQNAERSVTHRAIFDLWLRRVCGTLVENSEHVLHRLCEKIRNFDLQQGHDTDLSKVACCGAILATASKIVDREAVEIKCAKECFDFVTADVRGFVLNMAHDAPDVQTLAKLVPAEVPDDSIVRRILKNIADERENNEEAERSKAQVELSAIFEKISAGISKESTREALQELHRFKSAHEDHDIEQSLKTSGASAVFQKFILRELKKMDASSAAKATDASSSSVVTNESLNARLQKLRARFLPAATTTTAATTTAAATKTDEKKRFSAPSAAAPPLPAATTPPSPSRLRAPRVRSPGRKLNDGSSRSLASLRERLRGMKQSTESADVPPSSSIASSGGKADEKKSASSSSSMDISAMKAKLLKLKSISS